MITMNIALYIVVILISLALSANSISREHTGKTWDILVLTNIDANTLIPHFFLQEGILSVKGIDIEVMHTPGHSPGSISLYWQQEKTLIVGDLIFKDGIGRTDIPGGSSEILKQSIVQLRDLNVEHLLPGHGELISGKENVKANFMRLEQFWFSML